MILLLAGTGFWFYTLCTLFIIICILLIFMVVITPSQEGGMAAAFGGMGSDTFFGTKAHQHISKFTVFLAVSFLLLAVFINRLNTGSAIQGNKSKLTESMKDPPTPPGPQPSKPPLPPNPNK